MSFFSLFSLLFATNHRHEVAERKLRVIIDSADPKPAHLTGAKECQRSGVCCWRRPCELAPGDEQRIADHLGISKHQLFAEYLVVDDAGDGRLMLVPRRGQQAGGAMLTAEQTYDMDTPCVFLDVANRNACKIHPVKPSVGAAFVCTMTAAERRRLPRPRWNEEQLRELGWDGIVPDFNEDDWSDGPEENEE